MMKSFRGTLLDTFFKKPMYKRRILYYCPKKYSFIDITRMTKIFLTTVISLTIVMLMMWLLKPKSDKVLVKLLPQEVKVLVIKENNTFSKEEFIKYLKEINIKFPHIVYAQAWQESRFSSPIFKENNNLFGMKLARSRTTTATGLHRKHAMYNSWKECVLDYALYQASYLNHIKTEEQYLQYLKSYAGSPTYVQKISALSKKFKYLF